LFRFLVAAWALGPGRAVFTSGRAGSFPKYLIRCCRHRAEEEKLRYCEKRDALLEMMVALQDVSAISFCITVTHIEQAQFGDIV